MLDPTREQTFEDKPTLDTPEMLAYFDHTQGDCADCEAEQTGNGFCVEAENLSAEMFIARGRMKERARIVAMIEGLRDRNRARHAEAENDLDATGANIYRSYYLAACEILGAITRTDHA